MAVLSFCAITRCAARRGTSILSLYHIDHLQHLDSALVLDAEVGDIVYWPAEWWHVGEVRGSYATTLGLGVLRSGDLTKHLSRAIASIRHKMRIPHEVINSRGGWSANSCSQSHLGMLDDVIVDRVFRAALQKIVLDWITSGGLDRVPLPKYLQHRADKLETFEIVSPSAIGWTLLDKIDDQVFNCRSILSNCPTRQFCVHYLTLSVEEES